MQSTVEPVAGDEESVDGTASGGNRVKIHISVPAAEFDKALDAAFKKLSAEVRIPGFRPGKAPRALLEKRLGTDIAREQALQDALPQYYVDAVMEHDVDVIGPPEIDITAGKDDGDIEFDAVVEIRPRSTRCGNDSPISPIPNSP
jgi:trigger factor